MCEADGSNPVQLTSFDGPLTGGPHWSPDGRQIVFESRAKGHADIYVMNAEGGNPRRLTTESSNDVVPSWSRDGRWIYFASNRNGAKLAAMESASRRRRSSASHEARRVAAVESLDGKFIYYAKFSDPGIWRMLVEGGEESLVLDQLEAGILGLLGDGGPGHLFRHADTKHNTILEFFNFATRRVTQVAALEKNRTWGIRVLRFRPMADGFSTRKWTGWQRHHAGGKFPVRIVRLNLTGLG